MAEAKATGPLDPVTMVSEMIDRSVELMRTWVHWDGSPAVVQSRAIDETGYVQPTLAELLAVRGENHFYHNNAIQSWKVAADGIVHNVHV